MAKQRKIKTIKLSHGGKRYTAEIDFTDLARKKKQKLTIFCTTFEEVEKTTYKEVPEEKEVEKKRTKNGKDSEGKAYKKGDKYLTMETVKNKVPVVTMVPEEIQKEVVKIDLYAKLMHFQIIEFTKNYLINNVKISK